MRTRRIAFSLMFAGIGFAALQCGGSVVSEPESCFGCGLADGGGPAPGVSSSVTLDAGPAAACMGYSAVRYPVGDPCPPTWAAARLLCGTPCTTLMGCAYEEAGGGDSTGHCSPAVLRCSDPGDSGADAGGTNYVCGQ